MLKTNTSTQTHTTGVDSRGNIDPLGGLLLQLPSKFQANHITWKGLNRCSPHKNIARKVATQNGGKGQRHMTALDV